MTENYEKDFVPKKPALVLKELGFDEPCFGWYSKDGTFYEGKMTIHQGLLLAPLYQQAFRWFRKKHRIGSWIHHYFDMDKGTFIYSYVLTLPHRAEEYVYDTYEEAELECLKKLIEIVKQQL
jgi:hypothetical protein